MKVIQLEYLLDENVRLETIPDMETLKKVMKKVIDNSSYTNCKEEKVVRAVEDIFAEYESYSKRMEISQNSA